MAYLGRPNNIGTTWIWDGTKFITGSASGGASSFSGWTDLSGALNTTSSVSIDKQARNASAIGSDVFFFVSGSQQVSSGPNKRITVFGGDIYSSASAIFVQGISGSLQSLSDGASYLVAGTNVTITSISNGPIIIASTSPAVTGTWYDPGNSFITTGSVSIDSQGRNVSQIGDNVFFYVSGTIGPTTPERVPVVGADLRISGTLQHLGGKAYNVVYVTGSYVMRTNDYLIAVNQPIGSSSVIFTPDVFNDGQSYKILDAVGNASSGSIIISASFPTSIVGSASYSITENFGKAEIVGLGLTGNWVLG